MERKIPNEHKLKHLYVEATRSPKARLEIANIFKQTNFGLGRESMSFLSIDLISFVNSSQGTNLDLLETVPFLRKKSSQKVQHRRRKDENEADQLRSRQPLGWLRDLLPRPLQEIRLLQ